MKVEIKDMKVGRKYWDLLDPTDDYVVYSAPEFVDGQWQVEVTTSGDYAWTWKESDKNTFWDDPRRTDEPRRSISEIYKGEVSERPGASLQN